MTGEMKAEYRSLLELQRIDGEIGRRQQALADLDQGLQLRARIAELKAALEQETRRLRGLEKEQLASELEMKGTEAKRKDFSDRLYGGRVRNPKELGDLEREVEMLSASIGKLEDRVLGLMEAADGQRSQVRQIESDLTDQQERLKQVLEIYGRESARLQGEIAQLQAEREKLLPEISTVLLRRYDQIRARHQNLGVVAVTGELCPACRVTFSLDLRRQLKQSGHLQTCENCGRLLIWEGT